MKEYARKAWNGFRAAITSPEAVKAEKSLAILIVTRVLLAIGAGDAFVRLAEQIINGL